MVKEIHRQVKKKVSGAVGEVRKEMRSRTSTAIITAFALVMALAWQDAIKEIVSKITEVLNVPQDLYFYKIISAVILTFICVLGITLVSRSFAKKDQQDIQLKPLIKK